MSYLDPQSWTDVDSAGNAVDWSSRQGKLTYPAYEMIRRALYERASVIGDVINDGSPQYMSLSPRGSGKIYPTEGGWPFLYPWHQRMRILTDGLLRPDQIDRVSFDPFFMNYNLFDQWENSAYNDLTMTTISTPASLANWTNSALINDGVSSAWSNEDYNVRAGSPIAHDSLRAYELIRRMRWVYRGHLRFASNTNSFTIEKREGWGATLSEARNAWLSNSWLNVPLSNPFPNEMAGNYLFYFPSTPSAAWRLFTIRAQYTYNMLHTLDYTGHQKINIFSYFRVPFFYAGQWTYSNPDYPGSTENAWGKIYEDTEPIVQNEYQISINHKPDDQYFTLSDPNTGWAIYPRPWISDSIIEVDHRVAINYDNSLSGAFKFNAPLPA